MAAHRKLVPGCRQRRDRRQYAAILDFAVGEGQEPVVKAREARGICQVADIDGVVRVGLNP
jgi:hypothetical protein